MSQSGDPFADVLKGTLELSKQVQAGQDAEPDDEEQVVERVEGRIRVTAGPGGEIGISLKPKAMRLGSEELAQELTSAVNEALASLRERQLNAKNLDLDAINEQVAELQQKASAQLSSFMDGILRAHAAADRTEPVEE